MKKRWGLLTLLVFLIAGGMLGWNTIHTNAQKSASTLQATPTVSPNVQENITSTVDAAGTVRSNQSAVLTWQAGGTVGEVNVKVGDTVHASDTLASLSTASLPANMIDAQSSLISAQQTLDNLQQSKVPQAQALVDLLNAQQAYTDTLTVQLNLINWTKQPAYITAEQNMERAQDAMNAARTNYDQSGADNSTGRIPGRSKAAFEFRKAKRKFMVAKNKFDLLGGQPTQYELDRAAANTALAQARMQDAQVQYEKVKNGPSAADLAAAKASVEAAQATINQAKIIAPFNGTITVVDVKPGDLVSSGTAAFQIDDVSSLYVDLQVSEVDVNKVQVGQEATLTLDAVPNKQYNGKITNIGSVGTTSNGAVYYITTVIITNPDGNIKPGMTATASITVK